VLCRASANDIREIKLREVVWVGNVASLEAVIIKNAVKNLVGKEKTPTKSYKLNYFIKIYATLSCYSDENIS
jgi:hypothetical protein